MSQKFNVLYISHESGLNGAPRSLLEMIKGLGDKIEAYVVVPQYGPLEQTLREWNVETRVISFVNLYREVSDTKKEDEDLNYRKNGNAALEIAEWIKEKKIDLVHTNSSVSDVGALAAAIAGVPHVWHIREFMEEDFQIEYLDTITKKKLLQLAMARIGVSKAVSNAFYEKYEISLIPILDGMDTEKYKNDKLHVISSMSNILFAGVISKAKGQFEAIQAVALLLKEKKWNGKLYIVGNGNFKYVWSMKEYIRKNGLEQHIKIIPFQNDLAFFRSICDLALICSKAEALGRVTIEAMCSGILVIGGDTCGTKELIGEEQLRGMLYAAGDPVDLAKKIEQAILMSQEEEDRIRKEAMRFVQNEVELSIYCEKIYFLYQDTIAKYTHKQEEETIRQMVEKYAKKEWTLSPQIPQENKFRELFLVAEQLLELKQTGKSMADYFVSNNIHSIAIYGMNFLGCHLYQELQGSGIEVKYGIDQMGFPTDEIIKVFHPNDELPDVELIVSTIISSEMPVIGLRENEYRVVLLKEIISWMQMV